MIQYYCVCCDTPIEPNVIASLCDLCYQKAYKYATRPDHLLRYVEPVTRDGEPTENYLDVNPPVLLSDEEFEKTLPTIEEEEGDDDFYV